MASRDKASTSEPLCRDRDLRGQAFGQRESRGIRWLALDRPAVEYDLDRDPPRNPPWLPLSRSARRAGCVDSGWRVSGFIRAGE
jgi:hypothetical protein